MSFHVLNLLDIIDNYGEEAAQKRVSSFRCSLNSEIERFLLEHAVEFAKKKISITYLVVNDEEKIVAYFTLAHKPTLIPVDGLSQTMQKKLSRFAIFNVEDRKYNASAFLIAQLGKNTEIGKESCPAGSVLMGIVLDILRDVQHRIGGGIVFLECEDNGSLLKFYTDNHFKTYGRRLSTEGVTYHQLLNVI